jgi:hypothetical protein
MLSKKERIKRLTTLYTDDEILDIVGWYDDSNPDIEHMVIGTEPDMNQIYEYSIDNGNFEESIENNLRFSL